MPGITDGAAATVVVSERTVERFGLKPLARIVGYAQAAVDPHPWERRAMVEVPDFLAGTIAVSGDFWHFSRTPAIVGTTPQVGEHNQEVLGGLLGYSEDEIAELYNNNVISLEHHYDEVPG